MSINSNYLLSQTLYKSNLNNRIKISEDDTEQLTQQSVQQTQVESTSQINPVLAGLQSSEIKLTDIKAAIYNYNHPSLTGITITGSNGYGTDFKTICQSLGVGPNQSITKSDLTKLTRNDTKEDANKDLCGALNRAFSYLGPNDTISYNDLMLFFMRGAGVDCNMSLNEYKTVVNNYAQIVQNQYEACTNAQAKLEFVIEKTRDYLNESGMTMQLDALDRLTVTCADDNIPNEETLQELYSQYNVQLTESPQIAWVGQIAYAPIQSEKGTTLGSYVSVPSDETYEYNNQNVNMWVLDYDWVYNAGTEENPIIDRQDFGITLNSNYFLPENQSQAPKWYEVVETLVHELTHATAYFYYTPNEDNFSSIFTQSGLSFMENKGIISSGEYNIYSKDPKLVYLVQSMWDEFAAYYSSCNYWDSIAGDVFEPAAVSSENDLNVNGSQEAQAILNHIAQYYDNVAIPLDQSKWDIYNTMFYS